MSCTQVCKLPRGPRRSDSRRWPALLLALGLMFGCATRGAAGGADQAAPLVIEVPDDDLDAEVFVDGNYVGQVRALRVPETGPILLAPGIHRVEVRKPGRFPVQRTVSVKKDDRGPVVVRAELLEDPA
jgi:hypothetical protein